MCGTCAERPRPAAGGASSVVAILRLYFLTHVSAQGLLQKAPGVLNPHCLPLHVHWGKLKRQSDRKKDTETETERQIHTSHKHRRPVGQWLTYNFLRGVPPQQEIALSIR